MSGTTKTPRSCRHVVRLRRRRTVRGLDDDPGSNRGDVVHRDLVLERGGDQDVDVQGEEIFVRQGLAAGEVIDRLVLGRVLEHLRNIEAFRVVHATPHVGDGDDLRAQPREQVGR